MSDMTMPSAFDMLDASPQPQVAAVLPPHSIEAENSVLGALLLDNKALDVINGLIDKHDFYRLENQLIFEAIATLINSNRPADVVTVFEHLQSLGKAEEAGGLAYLNSLAQYVPSSANIQRYSEIVLDKSQRRKLAEAANSIARMASATDGREAQELISAAQEEVFRLSSTDRNGTSSTITESMMEVLELLQSVGDDPRAHRGQSTGFESIDDVISGMTAGQLIVLAARPGMGKTALAINIASHISFRERKPTAIFSLEMSRQQLAMRFLASEARVPLQDLREGQLSDHSWSRLSDAAETIHNAPMEIDEAASLSAAEIRARARSFARKYKGQLSLVVVDHIHIMDESGSNQSDNKASRMGEISRSLKAMAKELGCPVIALAQLNRSVESRTDKRPMMSDLRESGAIEQDADVILMLYRDEYYNKDACKEPGVAELIVAKQRDGAMGVTVKLGFQAELVRFHDLSC